MKNRLKLIPLFLALALAATPALRAQDATAPADKPGQKRERGPGAMMERAVKELGLNADQEAKWKAIGQQEKTALEALRDDKSVAKEDKRAKMREINKSFADQRRALLTPDQATKFDEMRAKMRERGPRGGGDRPAKGGDKPDDNK
jgi:Spy/CpxP family protein refolding chaperone